MNEQYSNTSPTASAFYDPESSCWRMCQASFPLDLDEEADWTLLQRLPDFIMWDGQALFEQATPLRLIAVRDGSALPNLPTPRVSMKNGPSERELAEGNPKARLETAAALLPTPTARDWKDTGDLKKSVPDDDSLLPRAIAHHVISDPTQEQSDDGNEPSDDPPPTLPTTGGTCRPGSSSG